MPRAGWKGKYLSFFSNLNLQHYNNHWLLEGPNMIIRRNTFLLKQLLNCEFLVYTGYDEVAFNPTLNHLGLNISSFVLTRDYNVEHAKKKKKRTQQGQQSKKNNTVNKKKAGFSIKKSKK